LLIQAWTLFEQFRLEEISPILQRIEQLLTGQTADSTLVGEVNLFKGYLSVWLDGDGEGALEQLKEAKKRVPKTHKLIRAEIEISLALAYYLTGKEELAVKSLEEKINKTISSDHTMLSRLIAGLAFIFLYSSKLVSAVRTARKWRSLAEEWHNDYLEAWAKYILANAKFQSWRVNDALQDFAFVVEKRDILHKRAAVDAFAGLILACQFMGRTGDAMSTLEQMLQFAQNTGDPEDITLAESCRTRLSLLRGELEPAVFWARSFDEVNYMASMSFFLEIPSITQAKVLIAAGTNDDLNRALESVRSLRRQAESLHFTCQTIELLILEAMGLEQQGNTEEALEKLEEVVTLAGPHGWIRPFVELGPPMADLLKELRSQNVAVDYIGKILAAFSDMQTVSSTLPVSSSPPSQVTPSPIPRAAKAPQSLVEPLTNRELEILEMLAQRLQNKEIAEKLSISPTTVKTHLQNIYQKLSVTNPH
jgi:LuxR family maltose regulon positive regulatory protein